MKGRRTKLIVKDSESQPFFSVNGDESEAHYKPTSNQLEVVVERHFERWKSLGLHKPKTAPKAEVLSIMQYASISLEKSNLNHILVFLLRPSVLSLLKAF